MPINGTLLWIWSFFGHLGCPRSPGKDTSSCYETIRCNHDISNMDMPAMWITHHYNHWKTDMKGWIRGKFLVFVPKFDIWVRDPPNFHNNFSFFGTKKTVSREILLWQTTKNPGYTAQAIDMMAKIAQKDDPGVIERMQRCLGWDDVSKPGTSRIPCFINGAEIQLSSQDR